MDKNLAIQYTAVAIVILLAIVWAVYKLVTKKSKGPCSGCSLSAHCAKKKDGCEK
ncbi:MAG: FeoB-associated Cys-rich membrane protein [Muribaculaceae bacterium]|nr:FeoB-associated Cys-rich membrane protein [Muribaculaceae bacterium]